MSDVQSKLDNVIERLNILGATSEQIEWVENEWNRYDDSLGEDEQESERDGRREMFYRSNDAVLSQQIADGQAQGAQAEIDASPTPKTAQALADHEAEVAAQSEKDWELLGLNIETILDTVGDNAEVAYRLHALETTANKPRKTLLADLASIAWPNGKPAVDDEEAQRQAAADEAMGG